jgi:hypothetical protein
MDFGLVRVTFSVGDLVNPGAVDAHMAAPGATVLPVRFAIERASVGTADEPDTDALTAFAAWTAAVAAASGAEAVPDDGPVGPATCLLAAVRGAVAATPVRRLSEVVYGGLVLETGSPMGPRVVSGGAAAHARVAGRTAAFHAARSAAMADADRLLADPDVDRALMELMGAAPDDEDMRSGVGSLLTDVLCAAYACAVLVDVLPRGILVAGLAPVLTAVAPVPRLEFGPALAAQVRDRLGGLGTTELAWLANEPFDPDAVGAVLTAALLAGADCPPWEQVLAGTRTAASARALGPRWAASLRRTLVDLARAVAYPQVPGADRLTALLPGGRAA